MNFSNSPHLMGPLGALVVALKSKLMILLFAVGLVGANGDISAAQRVANLETAVFGGPNVTFPVAPTLLSGSADPLFYPNQFVFITATGVDAITLAAPVAGSDDFKVVRVFSASAHAHTITTPANTIVNGSSAAGDTLTFGAHVGANCALIAYQGLWYIIALNNVSLSEV